MPQLRQITPLLQVADIDRSVRFYTDTLGFQAGYHADGYAYLFRDHAAIRLLQATEAVNQRPVQHQPSCYIDVEELDDLYQALKPRLDRLPKGRVKLPFNQAYGQREFHVVDEDSVLIRFGEAIST